MKNLNLKYRENLVIIGSGGISEDLINRVHYILENEFGFYNLPKFVNGDITNVKPFLDSEIKWNAPKSEVKRYNRHKHIVILQNSKVIDNRLEFTVNDMENRLNQLNIDDKEISEILGKLKYFAYPDMINKIAPRFTSSRFNPASMEKQLAGIIKSAKMGGQNYVSLVMPKTIFEWSHHWLKKWVEDESFEMPSYDDFIGHMKSAGMDSLIIFNPHAPKENLELSRKYNFNSAMIFPQTFTLSSNGWIYSIEKLFSHFNLVYEKYDPIKKKLNNDKAKLGDFQDIAHLIMYSSAVDEGSRVNSQRAANRFGLGYVESLKKRKGEGDSELLETENLDKYLHQLKEHTSDITLKIYIFDDMVNSGRTANSEAKDKKEQILKYNKENSTNYKIEVEVIASHLRFPQLEYLEHDFIDKITVFDSVPYLPSLDEQIQRFNLGSKINVLPDVDRQLALGIVMDYMVQNIHQDFGRHHFMGQYREGTDKEMVKYKGFGQDLENMMTKIEREQDKIVNFETQDPI